jgi:hypothetical protein
MIPLARGDKMIWIPIGISYGTRNKDTGLV